MESEVAVGLNPKNISESKNLWRSERDISTYPFQATRPLSVLFSIEIQVPLAAAIKIARGGSALQTQKADIASVAGLERFGLTFSRLGWVSFLLSPGFSAHAGGGKFKLRRPVKRLDLCLAL
jgi:hypothetical protein